MIIQISGSAPIIYPIEQFFCLLHCQNSHTMEIPIQYPLQCEWGKSALLAYDELKDTEIPRGIDIVYLSIVEKKFYSIESAISSNRLEDALNFALNNVDQDTYPTIVIGMAPYGLVAIWIETRKKTELISIFTATEIELSMNIFRSAMPSSTLENVCKRYIENHIGVKENLEKNGLPPRNLFDKYMQQFTYRYLLLFEKWINQDDEKWRKYDDEDKAIPEFEYIEEALYDGTHDKLHDDGLLKYHEAGKPKKLAVKWHVKKSEYTAYFWFEDEEICAIFDKFYGAHRDTKTDFIIHIDSEKNKYELALYRYGLKEPHVIAENAYQLIVFKNKFECYRSENYDQPKGAWIW